MIVSLLKCVNCKEAKIHKCVNWKEAKIHKRLRASPCFINSSIIDIIQSRMSRRRRCFPGFSRKMWMSMAGIVTIVFFVAYVISGLVMAFATRRFQPDDVTLNGYEIERSSPIRRMGKSLVRRAGSSETFIAVKNLMGEKVKIKVPRAFVRHRSKKSRKQMQPKQHSRERLPPLSQSSMLLPGTEEEIVTRKILALRHRAIINTHDYLYNIDPVEMCSRGPADVIVAVTIPPHSRDIRQSFRKNLWGGYGSTLNRAEGQRTIMLFFYGIPTSTKHQRMIKAESELFGDIVQANYIDTPANGSIKVVSALSWIISRCPDTRFVITATESCMVNIPLMLTELRLQRSATPLFLLGKAAFVPPSRSDLCDGPNSQQPPRGWRDGSYTTSEARQGAQFLEKGCVGFPQSTARLLYEASLRVAPFHLEHVFLTGICASLISVARYDNKAFHFAPAPEASKYARRVLNPLPPQRLPEPYT